jgi:hypothetical protein
MQADGDGSVREEGPVMLRFMAVLSFLNCGFFLIAYGVMVVVMIGLQRMPYQEMEALFLGRPDGSPEAAAEIQEWLPLLHANGVLLMAIFFLRTAVRFIGVLLMWKGRLLGFHVYAVAQLAGIFAPHIVLPWSMLQVWPALAAVAMTAFYGNQRRWLH